jgi:hypothetical protein
VDDTLTLRKRFPGATVEVLWDVVDILRPGLQCDRGRGVGDRDCPDYCGSDDGEQYWCAACRVRKLLKRSGGAAEPRSNSPDCSVADQVGEGVSLSEVAQLCLAYDEAPVTEMRWDERKAIEDRVDSLLRGPLEPVFGELIFFNTWFTRRGGWSP